MSASLDAEHFEIFGLLSTSKFIRNTKISASSDEKNFDFCELFFYRNSFRIPKYMRRQMQKMLRFMVEEWDKIPQEVVNNVIMSMKWRYESVLEKNGDRISYWFFYLFNKVNIRLSNESNFIQLGCIIIEIYDIFVTTIFFWDTLYITLPIYIRSLLLQQCKISIF